MDGPASFAVAAADAAVEEEEELELLPGVVVGALAVLDKVAADSDAGLGGTPEGDAGDVERSFGCCDASAFEGKMRSPPSATDEWRERDDPMGMEAASTGSVNVAERVVGVDAEADRYANEGVC